MNAQRTGAAGRLAEKTPKPNFKEEKEAGMKPLTGVQVTPRGHEAIITALRHRRGDSLKLKRFFKLGVA